jgi:dimethylargininase
VRPLALVRGVPASFDRALAAHRPDPPIDVDRARRQHDAYAAALEALGVTVERLPADDALPDSCFVEDVAVAAGGVALITRPGASSRRGEVDAVAAALARHARRERLERLERMEAPATLDGGDCLRVGRRFYVGVSRRTSLEGIARLARAFPDHEVIPVEVPAGVLHLMSVCSPLPGGRVLLAEGTLDPARLPGAEVVLVPRAEAHAANAVAIGDGVLAAAGAPRCREVLAALGLRVIEVDTSELRKADGALTCLSVRLEA